MGGIGDAVQRQVERTASGGLQARQGAQKRRLARPIGPTQDQRLAGQAPLLVAQAVQAVLSVFPLDTFVDDFAGRMEVVGAPAEVPPVQQDVQAEIDRAEGRARPMIGIERFAFYDMARQAYAVIQTGERRFYGCFMLRKGVIPPEA